MKTKFSVYVILFILIGPQQVMANAPDSMAVYGDSLSTGAVANPEIRADMISLLGQLMSAFARFGVRAATDIDLSKHLPTSIDAYQDAKYFNIDPALPKPTRIWWNNSHLERDGTALIDTEVYSWPYMISQKLGMPPDRLLIAAQNGKRVSALYDQASRVLEYTKGELPQLNFVFFSGNDICKQSVYDKEIPKLANEYKKNLESNLNRMITHSTPNKRGSEIYILEFIDILQAVDNHELLRTVIPFQGLQVTCLDVRYGLDTVGSLKHYFDIPGERLVRIMQSGCPSVQTLNPESVEKILFLRELQESIRESQRQVVRKIQKDLRKGFKVSYLPIGQIKFAKGDVANDCFHPSIHGQERIAREVYKQLKQVERF